MNWRDAAEAVKKLLEGRVEPDDGIGALEGARRREHGLTSEDLYPARLGEWKAATRATAKKRTDQ